MVHADFVPLVPVTLVTVSIIAGYKSTGHQPHLHLQLASLIPTINRGTSVPRRVTAPPAISPAFSATVPRTVLLASVSMALLASVSRAPALSRALPPAKLALTDYELDVIYCSQQNVCASSSASTTVVYTPLRSSSTYSQYTVCTMSTAEFHVVR
jgi:hypothetical protein